MSHLTLPAEDGFPLSVHRFDPPSTSSATSDTVKATCVIINATGVQARFYHPFASWLAQHGVAVCTFDFRYSGTSLPPDVVAALKAAGDDYDRHDEIFHQALLDCPKDWGLMSHWTQLDLAAVVRYAKKEWKGKPLTLLGNSLGGHLACLLKESILFSEEDPSASVKVLNVCGGNAFWGNNPRPEEAKFAFNELITQPLESEGVFRASSLGLGYDLPYGVGKDWLRWFYHELFSSQGTQDLPNVQAVGERLEKYLYVGFEDDETITQHMMHQHLSLFSHRNENINSCWVDPPRNQPPWPKCGHVTSFSPSSSKSQGERANQSGAEGYSAKEEDQEDEEDGPPTPGTDSYEPRPSSAEGVSSADRLSREETIFQLYLDYIVSGVIPSEQPGRIMKRWSVADQRDAGKVRRSEQQRRSEAKRRGKPVPVDFDDDGDRDDASAASERPRARL